MKLLRIKYLQTNYLIQKKKKKKEKKEFNDINIDKYIYNTTNFHQELKGGSMKDQLGLFIQYYNINLLFLKSLPVKKVLIFHYLNIYKI